MPGSAHHFGQQTGKNLLLQRELKAQNLATALWQEWSAPRFPGLAEMKSDSPAKPARAAECETQVKSTDTAILSESPADKGVRDSKAHPVTNKQFLDTFLNE